MDWVNRVGLFFDFLAFWFAAPEILGENRLKRLEQAIEQGLRRIPIVVYLVLLLLGMGILNRHGYTPGTAPITIQLIALWVGVGALVYSLLYFPIELAEDRSLPNNMFEMLRNRTAWPRWLKIAATPFISTLFVGILITGIWVLINASKDNYDSATDLGFGGFYVASLLATAIAQATIRPLKPLIRILADDEKIRQRSLTVGVVLFVIGFVMQFIATF